MANETNAGDSTKATPATPQSNYQTLDGFLTETNTLLTNALLPNVWDKLKDRGYTETDIQDRQADLEALRTLHERQRKEYGEQFKATEDYNNAQGAIHEDYMDHLGLARIALKNDVNAQTAMGLQGKRKVSQSGYAGQGLLFYNNALENPAWKAALLGKGINEDELIALRDKLKNLDTLSAAQLKETAEAQEATKKRDDAYDKLHSWVSDFRETAKISLRRYPETAKQLGI